MIFHFLQLPMFDSPILLRNPHVNENEWYECHVKLVAQTLCFFENMNPGIPICKLPLYFVKSIRKSGFFKGLVEHFNEFCVEVRADVVYHVCFKSINNVKKFSELTSWIPFFSKPCSQICMYAECGLITPKEEIEGFFSN